MNTLSLRKEMELEVVNQYRVSRLSKLEQVLSIQQIKNDFTKTISDHK